MTAKLIDSCQLLPYQHIRLVLTLSTVHSFNTQLLLSSANHSEIFTTRCSKHQSNVNTHYSLLIYHRSDRLTDKTWAAAIKV
jgi:hypothetical protein